MDKCILSIFTYGAQTWSLTIEAGSTLASLLTSDEAYGGCDVLDCIRNTALSSKNTDHQLNSDSSLAKWDWIGHVIRMPEELWAKNTKLETERRIGRPRKRKIGNLGVYERNFATMVVNRDMNTWERSRCLTSQAE